MEVGHKKDCRDLEWTSGKMLGEANVRLYGRFVFLKRSKQKYASCVNHVTYLLPHTLRHISIVVAYCPRNDSYLSCYQLKIMTGNVGFQVLMMCLVSLPLSSSLFPLQEGDFVFSLESVKKLQDLAESSKLSDKENPRLLSTSLAAVCNNPDLPKEIGRASCRERV